MLFDHVTIRVADRAASLRFYETVFGAIAKDRAVGEGFVEWGDFSLKQATDATPATENLHVGWWVSGHALVDAFWRAGVDAGYADDGAPGPRPEYRKDYYGGFLRDPDGNSAEAVHHGVPGREHGDIDHLWLRVADVAAARAFYLTLAPFAGLELGTDTPERVQFRGAGGSFSLVAGTPLTRNVHIAFAADRATVDAFHAALTAVGYADNGPPGERPEYHPGYYGAFVLAPDGTNVELVDHSR